MKKIFVTRRIPEVGLQMLRTAGHMVEVSPKNRPLTARELSRTLRKGNYDGVLSLLTDTIDAAVFDAAPSVKIFANYAIGFNNFDLAAAKTRGVALTNTPGGGAERVAEHAWGLILALSCRIVEGDAYVKKGKYKGWDPMLLHGASLTGKTLGIVGTGRIGTDMAHRAVRGFGMKVAYYDIVRNEALEKEYNAVFYPRINDVLAIADIVSLHTPLTPETRHLMDGRRLGLMKQSAYLINTSRGPVVDEAALVEALRRGTIAGAGLDVFEREPRLARGLAKLSNVVLTPHIASATKETRIEMALLAAVNLIAFFEGKTPPNLVS